MRELVKVGVFTFAIDVTPQAAAESVGEYVIDAIDAGESLAAIKDAARVSARYAALALPCPTCGGGSVVPVGGISLEPILGPCPDCAA